MHLYIVRHAAAEPLGDEFPDDAARPLTDEGLDKTGLVARGLTVLGCHPSVIATSPLNRAIQTANALATVLAPGTTPLLLDELKPGTSPLALFRWLRAAGDGDTLIVGHMPELAQLVSVALGSSTGLNVIFKKAAAACLRFEGPPAPGHAALEWLLQPAALKRLTR